MNIYPLSSLIAALACFFFSALVLSKGRKNNQNRSFFLATVLTGIWTSFPFLTSIPDSDLMALALTRLLYLFAAFVPTAWFYFMINLLNDNKEKRKLFIFYFLSVFFAAISFTPYLIKGMVRFAPHFSPQAGPLYLLFIIFFTIVFISVLSRLLIEFKITRGYRRSQLIYVGWAYLTGMISGVLHFISAYAGKEPIPHDIFIIAYPCILTYAILKYRLMDITVTITRTGIFIAVYTLVLGLPFVAGVLNRGWFEGLLGKNWWAGPLVLMAALATVGPFLYIYLQKRAEGILLRQQLYYQEILRQTARGMTRIRNLKKLLNLLVDTFTETVGITHSAIFLFDEKSESFLLKECRNLKEGAAVLIEKDNSLVAWLQEQKEPLVYEEIRRKSEENTAPVFKELEGQMCSMHAAVIVAGFLEDRLFDILVLGDKRSGKIYTSEDLNIFSVLASQSALAIENATLYNDIEGQVNQRTKELAEVQKQLIQAEKLATVGTLAGGVAHEINNPLTAILTNVQMLLASEGDEIVTDRESLELMEEATKRCRTIVQKLMAYAKKPLEMAEASEVNLVKVINNIVAFLQYQLEQDNIRVVADCREKEYLVRGNSNELEQVVTNIVLNAKDAIKLAKKGGTIQISLVRQNGWININIKDNGIGISKETLPRIFDPFFTTKDVGKGLGLGLSICQAIVEKHHGLITVKSEVNKGSVFTVQLPRIDV